MVKIMIQEEGGRKEGMILLFHFNSRAFRVSILISKQLLQSIQYNSCPSLRIREYAFIL